MTKRFNVDYFGGMPSEVFTLRDGDKCCTLDREQIEVLAAAARSRKLGGILRWWKSRRRSKNLASRDM